jgi:hypothetical protein
MDQQTLVAAKRFHYSARALNAGDEFSARTRDARLLVALGHASIKPAAPAAPARQVTAPGAKPNAAPVAEAPRVKRAYKRRDMVAESIEEVPHVVPQEAPTQPVPFEVPVTPPPPNGGDDGGSDDDDASSPNTDE